MGANSLVERYKKATRRQVALSSGIEVTIRGLTPAEVLETLKGLPTMIPNEGKPDTTEGWVDAFDTNMQTNRRVICLATNEVVDKPVAECADDELAYELLTVSDVLLLAQEINTASGLLGGVADQMRRVLPDSGGDGAVA